MSERADCELLALHARGAPGAAEELDQRYRRALVRFASGYLADAEEAEDAAQEVLMRLFSEREPPLSPRAWLFRATRNGCLNRLRSRGRRPDGQPLPSSLDPEAALSGPLTRLARLEEGRELNEMLALLSEQTRELLRLRYAEGLSRDEIALVLGLEHALVKSRLYEGLKALRRLAEDLGD